MNVSSKPEQVFSQDASGRSSIRSSFRHSRVSRAFMSRVSLAMWDAEGRKRVEQPLEPTYRMHPEPSEMFRSDIATRIMTDLLNVTLARSEYDARHCATLSKNMADVIKQRMKEQAFSKRYKYVCVVTIGERRTPKPFGVSVSSRCIWNTDTDNFASASIKSKRLFAVATLYALYSE